MVLSDKVGGFLSSPSPSFLVGSQMYTPCMTYFNLNSQLFPKTSPMACIDLKIHGLVHFYEIFQLLFGRILEIKEFWRREERVALYQICSATRYINKNTITTIFKISSIIYSIPWFNALFTNRTIVVIYFRLFGSSEFIKYLKFSLILHRNFSECSDKWFWKQIFLRYLVLRGNPHLKNTNLLFSISQY